MSNKKYIPRPSSYPLGAQMVEISGADPSSGLPSAVNPPTDATLSKWQVDAASSKRLGHRHAAFLGGGAGIAWAPVRVVVLARAPELHTPNSVGTDKMVIPMHSLNLNCAL